MCDCVEFRNAGCPHGIQHSTLCLITEYQVIYIHSQALWLGVALRYSEQARGMK